MSLDDADTVDVAVVVAALQVVDLLVVEHIPEGVGLGLAHVHVGVSLQPLFPPPLRHLKWHARDFLKQLTW